jgi:hypothetical protein
MKRHKFDFKDGDRYSRPIRRQGEGPVRVEVTATSRDRRTLQVALHGSCEGTNWTEIQSWQSPVPGISRTGTVQASHPLLRARVCFDRARPDHVELFLIEAEDPAGDPSSERKEGHS